MVEEQQQANSSGNKASANNSSHSREVFRQELQRLKRDMVDMSHRMDDLIEKAPDLPNDSSLLFRTYVERSAAKRGGGRQRQTDGRLPDKQFVTQNSVLTDLFKVAHFRTIENIVIAILTLWAISTAVNDYFETKSFSGVFPSIGLIERAFVGYHHAIIAWIKMIVASFVLYPLAQFWANCREPGPKITQLDWVFFAGYLMYQAVFVMMTYNILFRETILGRGAALALSLEQVRLSAKMHAFVREVSRKMTRDPAAYAKKTDGDEEPLSSEFPLFGKYLYFMFAPTMVYRDNYPRTPSTDWGYVFSNFLKVFGSFVYVYYVLDRYIVPEFATYQAYTVTYETIIKLAFRCVVPGTTVYMMAFFGFLHSWLNAWAEMMRFGDRLYYKDWWNVTNYAEYWRTWNCLVHDWLYAYVYKDAQEVFRLNKVTSSMLVFGISALFHEYVLFAMLRIFYPILFLEFVGLGFPLTFVKSNGRFYNFCLWLSILIGMGMMIGFYSLEISARDVCPPLYKSSFWNAVIPRFPSCMKK